MIFEYRKYVATPGKLLNVHARFENHLVALFERHGMEVIGFWTPVHGGSFISELHYILRWRTIDAMQEAWARLVADPDWISAAAESERDGPLIQSAESHIWAATQYSPVPTSQTTSSQKNS